MKEAKRRLQADQPIKEDAELLQLLINQLPEEEINAARVYLRVKKSWATDPDLWFEVNDPDRIATREVSADWVRLYNRARDLLYRAFWFADRHALTYKELMAIFVVSGIEKESFTDPTAKRIHEDPDNWTEGEKGYQGQVYQRYRGPKWVLNHLNVKFTTSDFRDLVHFAWEKGDILNVEDNMGSPLKPSSRIVGKMRRHLTRSE